MDNRIFCRRDDMTVFAVFHPKEWMALRNAGKLDAELKRRRESGLIIDVEREPEAVKSEHVPPRASGLLASRVTVIVDDSLAQEGVHQFDTDAQARTFAQRLCEAHGYSFARDRDGDYFITDEGDTNGR